MLVKLKALMDSYVKNSEEEMFCRVFSGNELSDFFDEILEMLTNKNIVDIQVFNLKCLLCGSNHIFAVATITYQGKSNLKKFFGGNHYIY